MPLPARAIHFMGLNAVRVLTLISLILVFASTILVMVTNINGVNAFEANKGNNTNDTMIDCDYIEGTTVPNQPAGVFWAIVASLLIIFQTIILFFSEVSWPMKFFDKYFPVLGTKFGLGPLGIFQCLISTQILSHHVDDFTLVAGFFQFALGILNMLLGVGYRESAKSRRSITSWRAEAKGILPTSVDANRPIFINATPGVGSGQFSRSPSMQEKGLYPNGVLVQQETHTDAQSWKSNEKAGFGFGRQGEKAAGLRGFILQKPEESLPRYVSPAPAPAPTLSRTTSSTSGSSSFYSPERPNMPLPNRQQQQREGSRHSRTESDDSSHHDHPPTFKSSRTAI